MKKGVAGASIFCPLEHTNSIKKALSLILSLVMLLGITTGLDFSSYAETSGDYEYAVLADGTAKITKYKGNGGNVTIPSVLSGYSVTRIGEGAFYNCISLTSITISNGVTSIDSMAFYKCISLTNITIPNSVTSIRGSAFEYCTSLTSITIPNSVTIIDGTAFYNCTSLTSITIPDSVISIGARVFYNCISLTSITVDSNNKYYSSQDGVLFNKDKTILMQYPIGNTRASYTIPDSVTSIDYYAFSCCTSLTRITIPNSVKSIGDDAFSCCTNLTSVTLPNSVTNIGWWAFNSCTSLTEVYYRGCSEDDWNTISIEDGNDLLTSANRHYHDFNNGGIFKLPTCTEAGLISMNCKNCGLLTAPSKGEVLIDASKYPESDHNYSNNTDRTYEYKCDYAKELKLTFSDETETEKNYDYIYIYDCNNNLIGKYDGSNLAGKTITVDGDKAKIRLTSDSSNVRYGFSISSIVANVDLKATGHTAGEAAIENVVEATALSDGSYDEVVYCENCNTRLNSQHKIVPKKSTSISVGETKEVTITKSGECAYYLFVPDKSQKYKFYSTSSQDTYGYLYDENMNEIVHDDDSGNGNNFYIEYNLDAGKTYVFGCRFYSSSSTGNFNVTLEEFHTHSYNGIVTYPTCTSDGYTTYVCACGDSYISNYTDATGHSYNSGTVTTSATCTEDGIRTYTCYNCAQTKTKTIYAYGHNFSAQVVQPTCVSQGYTIYTCKECNDEYIDDYVPALGHMVGDKVVVAPTCTDSGWTETYCSVCGEFLMAQTIYPLGHYYTVEEIPSTCTSPGYTLYTCSYCGENYVADYISSTGHCWNSGKITKQPTCTTNGTKTYTCYNCSQTETETIPASDHNFVGQVISSTCTSEGYSLYSCIECGYSYTYNYIGLKSHTYKTTTTKATISKNGSVVTTCTECGNVESNTAIYYPKTITLSATSYTYDGKVKKPNVTVKGSDGKVISSNNYTVTYPSGRKNIGEYAVTIKFKGNYSGTAKRTFTIIPKSTSISSLSSPESAKIKSEWKKVSNIDGYEIQVSKSSNFSSQTKKYTEKASKNSKILKFVKKTKSYVRIRTYKTVKVNGKNKKIYSAWSKVKSIKVK